ncbi:MAG: L-glutamate gamma-semialdehyde dehydrogenase [Bacteroidia bacterium]|nr:L-glutamate gamma-semialdehyde dehydrogenase [Bacteroidia bacterium]MDW8345490.1 L-glutamate gamma-semialdehyde dehydrogenase [Bacteroidia bacterium]
MSTGFYNIPEPKNEPVYSYAVGSKEREYLKKAISEARSQELDIPMYIGSAEVRTGVKKRLSPPHDHKYTLGYYHQGNTEHIKQAIDAALQAKKSWENMAWEHRLSIFLKAADLIATKYRYVLNAATMLGQSKNVFQAEIDSACELIDFLRFNAYFAGQIYAQQPISTPGVWNRVEQRPLEGFVFALTPFNFTAIAGNLPTAPAMMGNTVVWKPANTQIYAAQWIMRILKEAGLPDGVINLIYVSGTDAGQIIFKHPDFAGIHFTGGTTTFRHIWKEIGNNIHLYKSYPRIVGETGGKDYVFAHPTADVKSLSTALIRGAFEYQGQKCSAASRAYIPKNLWSQVKDNLLSDLSAIKMGGVEDFSNFINAVIDENSFDNIVSYIEFAKKDPSCQIIAGGKYDKSKGYFIEPTLILTTNPTTKIMCEEIFGPVLTIYVYEPDTWKEILDLVNTTSEYALTGAIFAQDRYAIEYCTHALRHASGNFYINDKPTGAVVGQQPFGGSRASGTNDKAGSLLNLLRWVSPRAIKETFVPPTDFRYPFMDAE